MRFNMELSEEEQQAFDDLMKRARGKITKKDLVWNALSLLEWAFQEREADRIIASVDSKKRHYREVIMPVFP